MMHSHQILMILLDKLKERTNYCPYCSGEYVHTEQCPLEGLWFANEVNDENND